MKFEVLPIFIGDILDNQSKPIFKDFLIFQECMVWEFIISSITEKLLDCIFLLLEVQILKYLGHAIKDSDASYSSNYSLLIHQNRFDNLPDIT